MNTDGNAEKLKNLAGVFYLREKIKKQVLIF